MKAGKTQSEIAQVLGLCPMAYGSYEHGKTEPSLKSLIRLCRFYGVTSDWLLGLDRVKTDSRDEIVKMLDAMRNEMVIADGFVRRMSQTIAALETRV